MQKILNRIEKIHILYIVIFLFSLSFISYGNTLGNSLFFDDEDFIYKNIYVQKFSIVDIFTHNLIAGAGKISNYYRPVLSIIYSIIYSISMDNGMLYHLAGIILHAGTGTALFLLLKKMFSSTGIALISSVIFIIHPINTEAVAYASGINDPLSSLFMISTIIISLGNNKYKKIISAFLFTIALLSRETAIITPALIFIIFLFETKSIKETFIKTKSIIPLIIIALLYFLLRLTILNFQHTLNFFPVATAYSTNIIFRVLTFFSIIPEYIALIFFPKTLNIEREVPVVISYFSKISFFIIIMLIGIFDLCLKYFNKYPVFLFSFLWFFITISPTMGIIPINGIMYEHFLYLSSIGIFLPFSFCFITVLKKISNKSAILITFLLLIFLIGLIIRTINRNNDWNNPITFYTQTIKINSNSARLHNNLAMAFAENKQNKEAIKEYKEAIRINDIYAETHFNLANSYVGINDLKNAEAEYKKALEINPLFLRGYTNLVSLYKYQKRNKDKEEIIKYVNKIAEKNKEILPFIKYLKGL